MKLSSFYSNTGIIVKKLINPLRGFLFNILENTFIVNGVDTIDPLPATTPKGGDGVYKIVL